MIFVINPLNAELNPICHLLALLGSAAIVVVSRLRVKGRGVDSLALRKVFRYIQETVLASVYMSFDDKRLGRNASVQWQPCSRSYSITVELLKA